ncbi:MAG TPA: phosphatidate cytidylyltransferase, partial [Burkholderiaceae bacterium]|nr:phosphatidate cytidylyltransferase [Burkholderiaceae bacterium]
MFESKNPVAGAALWTIVFVYLAFQGVFSETVLLFALCAALWTIRLGPSLALGLPSRNAVGNRLLNGIYGVALLGCFGAIVVLYEYSALYLLS